MLNYIYYYWNYEKGLTGVQGWDIRAISENTLQKDSKEQQDGYFVDLKHNKEWWQQMFAHFSGLHYGKDMQEYVYRIKNQWVLFRVFKIASVNGRDDKACAVSWLKKEEPGCLVHFVQKELHHEEYAEGMVEEPAIVLSKANILPGKEFWTSFLLYLWQMLLSGRTCTYLRVEQNEQDDIRKILNLIIQWMPEWMKERFSAVLTEEFKEEEPVRLCIYSSDIPQKSAGIKVISWNQEDSVPKVRGIKQEAQEDLRQMLSEGYEWHQNDILQFENWIQALSELSKEQQNLMDIREYYSEYKMQIMEENLDKKTKSHTLELQSLLKDVKELMCELKEIQADSEVSQPEEREEEIMLTKEIEENGSDTDARENSQDAEEKFFKHIERDSSDHVISRSLHKYMESHFGLFHRRRKK